MTVPQYYNVFFLHAKQYKTMPTMLNLMLSVNSFLMGHISTVMTYQLLCISNLQKYFLILITMVVIVVLLCMLFMINILFFSSTFYSNCNVPNPWMVAKN